MLPSFSEKYCKLLYFLLFITIQACRALLGSRCILSNQCLGRCDQSSAASIYAAFKPWGSQLRCKPDRLPI